ncbi:ROK family protein [Pseudaestuariivita sp.]|uniref:ROK family protein n=1 Tax=Pseudaestuariivita sp. TaxID=2211669 RepID=UPI00405833FD
MSQDQRTRSRRVILDHIRRAGRIARIDLARASGISQATVTTLTAEMLRQGLIEEVAEGEGKATRRGRPRVDLKLRGDAHLVAGVKIAGRSVSVVVLDFEGTQRAHHKVPLADLSRPPDALGWIVRQAVEAAAGKAGVRLSQLSGVGVGIAGFIDALAGLCHWSPSLDRRNVAFRDLLSRTLALPVFLDNDANLVAMAEQYFGAGRGVTNFVVVTVEAGVGMGIVLGNRLYRGTRGCGAEFGHTKVQLDGALCRCGQRGCLEAYVADYALMREAQILNGGRGVPTIDALLSLARSGDQMAGSILTRATRMFAMGLANIVNIFDPQLIIVAGEQLQSEHLQSDDMLELIRASIVEVDLAPPKVIRHTWDDLMWAQGAGAFALDGVLDLTLKAETDHVA